MDARNNIVVATAGDDRLAITTGEGDATLADNWLQQSWRPTHDTLVGTVTDDGNVTGVDPGFADLGGLDLSLSSGSPCDGAAGPLAAGARAVDRHYVVHQASEPRATALDIGAFER
jgi:hypothetical protein